MMKTSRLPFGALGVVIAANLGACGDNGSSPPDAPDASTIPNETHVDGAGGSATDMDTYENTGDNATLSEPQSAATGDAAGDNKGSTSADNQSTTDQPTDNDETDAQKPTDSAKQDPGDAGALDTDIADMDTDMDNNDEPEMAVAGPSKNGGGNPNTADVDDGGTEGVKVPWEDTTGDDTPEPAGDAGADETAWGELEADAGANGDGGADQGGASDDPCADGGCLMNEPDEMEQFDACMLNPCENGGTCSNTAEGFSCSCAAGYAGETCDQEVIDCAVDNGGCGDPRYVHCVEQDSGRSCVDVNECQTNNGGCGDPTYFRCTNALLGPPQCADIDECATDNGGCGDPTAWECANNIGMAATCTNINECEEGTHNCSDNAACEDTEGSFTCTCNDGYAGDGVDCGDVDECSEGIHECDANATCTNTQGSYTCECDEFWDGDGFGCDDVDECQIDNGGCGDEDARLCFNNVGTAPTCTTGGLPEYGTVAVDGYGATVTFSTRHRNPVVVCSMVYENNAEPTVVRVSDVTDAGFFLHLQHASAAATMPAEESVSYIVVDEGTWTIDGQRLEAQTFSSTLTGVSTAFSGEAQNYGHSYTSPVVVGQVMTENDPEWSAFFAYGNSRTNPPSATDLVAGKLVAQDPSATRADETIGFIVFEAGHGTLQGIEFEAKVGSDSIAGVSNGAPDPYTFDQAFASTPGAAIVSLAALDGGDGGWAQADNSGATAAISTTGLQLTVDEDTLGDAERSHTSEQVAYLVFGAAVP